MSVETHKIPEMKVLWDGGSEKGLIEAEAKEMEENKVEQVRTIRMGIFEPDGGPTKDGGTGSF